MKSQVACSYGGQCLDSNIDGFTTLSVAGRGDFTRAVTATDLASDGAKYLSSRLESKKLTVKFFLKSVSLTDLTAKLGKLKRILSAKNTTVSFADDPLYKYVGTVTSVTLDDTTLHPTGSIEVTLSDPYCYSVAQQKTGTGKTVAFVDYDSEFSNVPLSVEFTPSSAISVFQMTSNQSKRFLLNQSVSAGKKVVVDFETLSCTVNGASVLSSVSLNSNFADFTIDKNTTLTFNSSGEYVVRFEVKKL